MTFTDLSAVQHGPDRRQFTLSNGYHHAFPGQAREKPFAVTVLFSAIIVVAISAVVFAGELPRQLELLLERLLDFILHFIPAWLLFAIDRWANPPSDEDAMRKPLLPASTHVAKREAMWRLLGLDKGRGLLQPVTQSFQLFHRPPDPNAPPPGLVNMDNSCFQNSILQALASLEPLHKYISDVADETKTRRVPPPKTVLSLHQLMSDLTNPDKNGNTFWAPGPLKNMNTWQQQDAQEYYSRLLDEVEKEVVKTGFGRRKDSASLTPSPRRGSSPISQGSDQDSGYFSASSLSTCDWEAGARMPLEGYIAQRVACVQCGYCEGLSITPFNFLTLSLEDFLEHDVRERLDHYTKIEEIEGVECVKCTLLALRDNIKSMQERTPSLPGLSERLQTVEDVLEQETFDDEAIKRCKIPPKKRVTTTKTKQMAIARAPQCLVLHMNRSVFDERTGRLLKNLARVHFPKLLDLGPWCLGSIGPHTMLKKGAPAEQDEEQWPLGPTETMVAGGAPGKSRIQGPLYELRAVVAHHGNHNNGHYVCFRQHPIAPKPKGNGVEKGETPMTSAPDEADQDDDDYPKLDGVKEMFDGETLSLPSEEQEPSNEPEPQWWRFSDEDVRPVSEKMVLDGSNVFMLFYDCIDARSVVKPPLSVISTTDDDVVSTPSLSEGETLDLTNTPTSSAASSSTEMPPHNAASTPATSFISATTSDELLDAANQLDLDNPVVRALLLNKAREFSLGESANGEYPDP
ncbi:terminal hydrolase-like protein [Thermochaetoides thermophila DSM 1495]|uniref:ubiquitinyl hydrolase 1 n=1 Tax=Chaetomium thermophilum (strain DSM 1495 / CBS 144.50 / IMI 039719) TaxID=759272 RepID=G0S7U9_CHATD|nr:terminal hydrolase-like protein [Thermochaetoides thermophila DSM 1495]EGS21049.1 terminal hydrolase-like protein [Thermochaetoides thermophila DSM 1495]